MDRERDGAAWMIDKKIVTLQWLPIGLSTSDAELGSVMPVSVFTAHTESITRTRND